MLALVQCIHSKYEKQMAMRESGLESVLVSKLLKLKKGSILNIRYKEKTRLPQMSPRLRGPFIWPISWSSLLG